ncbi:MAG TPA: methylated-DNA--[protein]-cysteine S-methyltransferase [Tepidisphaeraceae bacterium]|jgi:AraC family transcriptional regulator of adaptative response/methylated-DNA-[protein]-cysteine methyltransferase|nr:methylated-DNA--[protein]-cysteine S-methyltransferase [Tepidisphaeraceae bacterium]
MHDKRIRYVAVNSDLGVLLVAGTPAGVCALWMADEEASLIKSLRRRFPLAEPATAASTDAHVRQWARVALEITQGRGDVTKVPVDVTGTPFQKQVWRALRKIPRGQTRSYAQVAADIGRPAACRAVAAACGANPVGLFIPCHRVIREGGGLGGFAAGIERKKLLLERERARSPELREKISTTRAGELNLFSFAQ